MARTTKISIAIDAKVLASARKAAKTAGLSLSAFIARGVSKALEDAERISAARELSEEWALPPPTEEEKAAFLARLNRRRRRKPRAA
jgi:hypothetical protein